MTLQGENITLGLKLHNGISTSGLDYYFGYTYAGGDIKTERGVLMYYQNETVIWEKSSYHQSETIKYLNVYNSDSVTNKVSVYLGVTLIGKWELEAGERLEYVDGVGFTVKDANGLTKVIPITVTGGGDIPFSLQHEISGDPTITILPETTLLRVDPPTLIAALDIQMPGSPTSGKVIGILFGGTIDPRGEVVTELTFSSGTFYQGSTLTTANGSDYLEFQYTASQWLRIK